MYLTGFKVGEKANPSSYKIDITPDKPSADKHEYRWVNRYKQKHELKAV